MCVSRAGAESAETGGSYKTLQIYSPARRARSAAAAPRAALPPMWRRPPPRAPAEARRGAGCGGSRRGAHPATQVGTGGGNEPAVSARIRATLYGGVSGIGCTRRCLRCVT